MSGEGLTLLRHEIVSSEKRKKESLRQKGRYKEKGRKDREDKEHSVTRQFCFLFLSAESEKTQVFLYMKVFCVQQLLYDLASFFLRLCRSKV